jgi:hypothetical protein
LIPVQITPEALEVSLTDCALEMNATKRNNMVNSFFNELAYKPNDAFWSLKMEVMSAVDKPTE